MGRIVYKVGVYMYCNHNDTRSTRHCCRPVHPPICVSNPSLKRRCTAMAVIVHKYEITCWSQTHQSAAEQGIMDTFNSSGQNVREAETYVVCRK